MRPIITRNHATMQHRSRLLRALQHETPWVVESLRDEVLPCFSSLPADWPLNDWFRAFVTTPASDRGDDWPTPSEVFGAAGALWQRPVDAVDAWFARFGLLEVGWLRQHLLVVLKCWTEHPELAAIGHWEGSLPDHDRRDLAPVLGPEPVVPARPSRDSWMRELGDHQAPLDPDPGFRDYRWAAMFIAGRNDDGSFGWNCERISDSEANTVNLSGVRSAVEPILEVCELESEE